MDGTGLSYKEQEQGSSLIEKGYDFYKDIQFIEGQPNEKSGLNILLTDRVRCETAAGCFTSDHVEGQ